jgi:putative ABC transport system ATP-binding protein
MILNGEGLKKYFLSGKEEVHAVDDISIEIGAGEFTVLAGPSGSGKTTMLNLLGGLDSPDHGRIFLEGTEMTGLPAARLADLRMRRIGFVFQTYNLIPVLSAEENAGFVLMLQGVTAGERKKRAIALLRKMGLEGLENRRPSDMSGGQQQRVAVARALAADPALVLADEPTAHLDSASSISLLELMKKYNSEQGTTFLISSHDPMVMDMATRLVRLKDGRIVSDS